jgi:hypothetical protein
MQIPLQQFESYIDEAILKRGLSYFRKGAVSEVEEISKGQFEAIVSGSEDYTVHLEITDGSVTEHWCDCPYDMGPVCKHVVAVLFYLQQEEMELSQPRKKKQSAGKTLKKKTVEEQVLELLGKLSPEELKQFTFEQCISNPSFRQVFISGFAHLVSDESKDTYKQQIRAYIATIVKRRGFIDWSGAGAIGKSVDNLLIAAQKHLDQSHYQSTVYIACAVMEEMTPLLQYADDSDGAIGGPIENAFDLLHQVAQEQIQDSLRSELLDYCLTSFDKNIYREWDWHFGLLDLASALVRTEPEGNKVIACLDKTKASSYTLERIQLIKWELLRKIKGPEEAGKFLSENLANHQLRTIAIETAIQDRNFEKAVVLARDGIRADAKERPGYAYDWYDWLLKIALIQKDSDRIIEYARILFIQSNHHDQDYFQLLKKTVHPDHWTAFVEVLITDIQKGSRWQSFDMISGIFIREEWWDRLFDLLKTHPTVQYVEAWEKYLAAGYSGELVGMYSNGILSLLQRSSTRKDYREICRYLRRMKKLGGNDQCNSLVRKIQAEYPRRTALLEELSRV